MHRLVDAAKNAPIAVGHFFRPGLHDDLFIDLFRVEDLLGSSEVGVGDPTGADLFGCGKEEVACGYLFFTRCTHLCTSLGDLGSWRSRNALEWGSSPSSPIYLSSARRTSSEMARPVS